MRRTLLALLLVLTAVTSFAGKLIIPIAGHISGARGTFWTTDLSLTEMTGTPQQVQLIFHPAAGEALARTFLLAPGEKLLISDVVNPAVLGRSGTEWLGLLEINSTGSVKAAARTYTAAESAGGSFGSAMDALDPALLVSRGLIPGIVSSLAFRANIAFTNPTTVSQEIRFDIRDENGAVRASDSLTLAAFTTTQISFSNYLITAANEPLSLSWSSDGRAFGVASVIDNISGDPTTIPSLGVSSKSLFFPAVGRVTGPLNTLSTTAVAIVSEANQRNEFTLRYSGNDGTVAETTVAVPAFGTFRTDDLLQLLNLESGSGFLTVDTTAPAVGAARSFITRLDGATLGAAVLPQDSIARTTRAKISGVRRDANWRLSVNVANTNPVAAVGAVKLEGDQSQLLESHAFVANPGASIEIVLNQTTQEVRSGEIEVEVENGIPVTAIASNVDLRSGDTIIGEVEQDNERQHHTELSFSPRVATAGSPMTLTASLPGFSDVAYSWDFGDGTPGITGSSVTHTFATPGEFIVTVVGTLPGGSTVRESEDVAVVEAGGGMGGFDFSWQPANPAAGQAVTFTATGTANGSVEWHFPGDVRLKGNPVTYTFGTDGTYEVEAELEREGAVTLHARHFVAIGGGGGGEPVPFDFTWTPEKPAAGQSVTFTATGATGGVVKWRFPGDVRPVGNPVAFTFTSNGNYEVEAELERAGSATVHVKHIVTVGDGGGNPGPFDFSWTPATPGAGQEVTFTATGAEVGLVKWHFPGNVDLTGNPVKFIFTTSGSYEVEAELERGGFPTLHVKHVVTVGGGPPAPGATTVDFNWTPASPAPGQTVVFTATFDAEPVAGYRVKWRFPDDSRPTGNPVSYVFTAAGSFEVEAELEQPGRLSINRKKFVVVAP